VIKDKIYSIIPDGIIYFIAKGLCLQRLLQQFISYHCRKNHFENIIHALAYTKIAINTGSANSQHYELPVEYFRLVLGKHLKYSCSYWEKAEMKLGDAEEAMLKQYLLRADIKDNQTLLELGCGWGSLTLYIASHCPSSKIIAVSNSSSQQSYIEAQAKKRGLSNIQVICADINTFEPPHHFDRIISVEMIEHIRNHRAILTKIHKWLLPKGKLFVHHFCHNKYLYLFDDKKDGWMAKNFFTGGMMPCENMLSLFAQGFKECQTWDVNGMHYYHTAQSWLDLHKKNKKAIIEIFSTHYGSSQAILFYQYWRFFYLACMALFSFKRGEEWYVKHSLFEKESL